MRGYDYPILAREGTIHILIAGLAGVLSTMLWGWWSIPIWVLVVFILQFFRDPKRTCTTRPGVVVSPASGKVVFIGESDNPYHGGARFMKVSIFMNIFSVHSNLIPVAGEIVDIEYHRGKFLNAALDKSSMENERNALHIRAERHNNKNNDGDNSDGDNSDGLDVYCVQIAGLIARRIICYLQSGDSVQTGERYGFIRFGSRVDLYLPLGSSIEVKLGQWLDSGNHNIGSLPDY